MGNRANGKAATRCAIYTRKSSEEGLEQDFNSLDAQRESCEAFVLSQKHEGWIALPEMYDDGGISGATMDRPALKRLLSDIEAGQIDTVVVYKVDRLTRSLGDFAKIVEVFDNWGVSFVSVPPAFNPTTSMVRLARTMLPPVAQSEREAPGQRSPAKIAARVLRPLRSRTTKLPATAAITPPRLWAHHSHAHEATTPVQPTKRRPSPSGQNAASPTAAPAAPATAASDQ